MSVVVNEFEVVPEPQQAERPAAPAAAPPPNAAEVAHQVEGVLRKVLSRHARLRAT